MTSPLFSVVINTCDRCESLRTTLLSLRRQTCRDFEVVVVVGPTRDDTREMLSAEFTGLVRVIDCPQFNISRSRNLGVAAARGEVVAFIDDDAIPAPTWLAQLKSAYCDPLVTGAGGRTYDARPGHGNLQFLDGRFSVFAGQEDVRERSLAPRPGIDEAESRSWFPRFHGTNMSFRRAALVRFGGFDENYDFLFEEPDLAARIAAADLPLAVLDRATVLHVPRTSRNRGSRDFDLNWFAWMRGIYYFPLKNARRRFGLRAALSAASRLDADLLNRIETARRHGDIADDIYARAHRDMRRGRWTGIWLGLFGARRLAAIPPAPQDDGIRFVAPGPIRVAPVEPLGSFRAETTAPRETPVLRLALLSRDYPPHGTHGVARSTHALAHGLAARGHEVHVVTRGDRHRVYAEGSVLVHEAVELPGARYRELFKARLEHAGSWLSSSHSLWSYLDRMRLDFPIDLVDSTLWTLDGFVTAMAGELPVVVRPVTSMRQILALHREEGDPDRTLIGELERVFLERAAAIGSNSQATRRAVTEIYGIDLASRVHDVIPYGTIPSAGAPALSGERRHGGCVGLFVGRLEKRKGIQDLFAALPAALAESPDLRFRIVGDDNSRHDGFFREHGRPYPETFQREHAGLSARVEFLGHVSDAELALEYARCDFFVAPSHYESFGLVLLEAMERSKPVVACAEGGPLEILTDGETGLLVPVADPDALASAISRLAGDRALRRRLGEAGRERWREHFTHHRMAEGFERLYLRAIEARGVEPTDDRAAEGAS